MRRVGLYICITLLSVVTGIAQDYPGLPVLRPGDTIYTATDLLPASISLAMQDGYGNWDFTSLQSPFVTVRVVRRNSGATDDESFILPTADGASLRMIERNNNLWITGIQFNYAETELTGTFSTPFPFRVNATSIGLSGEYSGSLVMPVPVSSQLASELDTAARYKELRYVLGWEVYMANDAAGSLITTTDNTPVVRQSALVETEGRFEGKTSGDWDQVKTGLAVELPSILREGTRYLFWSAASPVPVAVVWTDETNKALRVEYLAGPGSGRLVEELPRESDVFVYPNPSYGLVRFDMVNLEPDDYRIEIFSILGVKLRTETFSVSGTRTVMMNLTDLKKGTYIYRLVDSANNAIRSKRLVIISP